MKLQEQVCTLEQAKRLKELGCEQGTVFGYYVVTGKELPDLCLDRSDLEYNRPVQPNRIAAYTVAELGEMLVKLGETEIDTDYENGEWTMAKGIETTPSLVRYIWHPTEAQARAALLIHILEQEKANV